MKPEKKNVGDGSPLTPDGQELIKKLNQSAGGVDEILRKDPKQWTEEDLNSVQKAVLEMSSNDPRRDAADEKVRRWYDHYYGTDPAERDATGRMVQPEAKTRIPKDIGSSKAEKGTVVKAGLEKISGKLGQMAGQLGGSRAASILQTGLNLLGGGTDSLKVDGDLGPKTKGQLDKALAEKGAPKVAEGLSLARFQDGLKDSGSKGLEQAADKSFSDLFPSNKEQEPKVWNQSIQDTINGLGRETIGDANWVDVKDDGRLGSQSKAAFDRVVKAVGPRAFIQRLGQEMNFLA